MGDADVLDEVERLATVAEDRNVVRWANNDVADTEKPEGQLGMAG